jgi:hypothetical protein
MIKAVNMNYEAVYLINRLSGFCYNNNLAAYVGCDPNNK